ncbi:GAF domain-containing protein [Cyanobacteria bacterium FACHB-63]|nr:GAF domain-containing protein [Cyanobacteria bacterium FACHB-63]
MTNPLSPKPLRVPLPGNEAERLAALQRYNILDTPPEAAFDRITKLAARLFAMPIALISLVDESRVWFKSCVGFGSSEVPRDKTLCSFAVLTDEPLIVPDTRLDDRFVCNPSVQSEPGVRFYAGAPLISQDGFNLGTLCLLDSQPHPLLTDEQQATLVDLAAMVVDELELRLAAHKVDQSEEKYRALFESIDEGFCIVEVLFTADGRASDHRILQANPAFARHSGISNPAGKTASELAPGIEQYWNDLYAQVIDTGEPARLEIRSDALDRWFNVLVSRVHGAAACQVAIVFNDITERKHNEDDRKRREANLAFLADITEACSRLSLPDEIMQSVGATIGAHLQITTCLFIDVDEGRGEVTVHYGWNSPDVLSTVGTFRLTESVSEEFQRASRAGEMVVVRNTQTDPRTDASSYAALNMHSFVTVPFHRDGKWTHYIAICDSRPCDWRDDELELIQEVSNHIFTRLERARAEALVADDLQNTQRLRELGERLVTEGDIQTLYQEILTTAITLTRADAGTVQIFDPATQDLLLLATQGFERNMIEYFYRVNVRSNTPCGMALKNGDRTFVNFNVPEREDPDGSMRLHVEAGYRSAQSTPLMARSGNSIGMISTHWRKPHQPSERELRFLDLLARQAADLIEQRQITAEREQLLAREQAARAEADRANRIKDEFLAVLSHELRSPLNPILGWTRLLQTGKLDKTRQRDALATIERNAKLQTQLIEDLLDISRILQGKLSLTAAPVNLAVVISAALETVRLAAEAKHIQITLDLAPNIAFISGDAARLQQVVWNLLTNAVKFTPQGGQATIELRQVEQWAQIRVIDMGKGIPADFLPHVFEYFRQQDSSTTRKFGGLGLGLAIVHQIVERHGGTVWAESRGENQGATFTVRFPVLPQTVSISAELPYTQVNIETPLDNVQILLVDDEPDTREFQAFLLEQSGANVKAVASGAEALQVLDQWIPDVIISDVGMAEMDGYMLIEQIRSRPSNRGGTIPMIALTAYAADHDRQRALQAGFQMHLTKPLEPEQFVSAIISLLKSI